MLEATIGLTLFLFVSLLLFHVLHFHTVKTVVYEAAAEAAEYAAELAYMEGVAEHAIAGGERDEEPDIALPGKGVLLGAAEMKLLSSLDEPELVEHYVAGGKTGILLLGSEFPDEDGDILLRITYTIEIDTPLLPTMSWLVEEEIHQKPYLGHKEDGKGDGNPEDIYVYVTDNREVYHVNRNCTHLVLKIRPGTKQEAVAEGYHSCEYCGKDAGDVVLICPEGRAYHSRSTCRGLRRTVHRIKKSEAAGLPPCSRCGK